MRSGGRVPHRRSPHCIPRPAKKRGAAGAGTLEPENDHPRRPQVLLTGGSVPKTAIHDPKLREIIDEQTTSDTFEALPTIRMWTADKKVLTGWLASQTDMLSDDWEILD